MSKFSIQKTLGILLVLALSACATTPAPTGPVSYYAEPEVRAAMRDLVINVNRSPDGYLDVVMIDGVGAGQQVSIEWSIAWHDASGRRVTGISDRYRRMVILPSAPFQLSANAPVRNAVRAHVHVRRSNHTE